MTAVPASSAPSPDSSSAFVSASTPVSSSMAPADPSLALDPSSSASSIDPNLPHSASASAPLPQILLTKTPGQKIGYTVGSFDLFHIGHLNILKKARAHCDYLIVGLNSDETILRCKNKTSVIPYEDRKSILEAVRYVDEVIKVECPGPDQKASDWPLRLRADIVFSGDDHRNSPEWQELIEYKEQHGGEVMLFPYTEKISTTKLRQALNR